ncbi:hypothetical protein [Stratiformator vulcanicus]|uniref:Uncharacterized protein n=1 Tax=Stratiformator vulcanicus TaxID=2527980 RepID=A0A517R2E0_9PLAN|nr:hypothetical protein [Stratiformator vulcanicus]QDT38042.1 hypothetical protein Pan189_24270 [Stratiformator vulcanicus]
MTKLRNAVTDARWLFAILGIAAGFGVAQLRPVQPAQAVTNDRNDSFAMCTCQMDALGSAEGVFMLDYLTGQLTGAALNNSTGTFTQYYSRNIAQDFNVDPSAQTKYTITAGVANLNAQRGVRPATSVLYIAELNSGITRCYAIPYQVTQRPVGVQPIKPIAEFKFRESI